MAAVFHPNGLCRALSEPRLCLKSPDSTDSAGAWAALRKTISSEAWCAAGVPA